MTGSALTWYSRIARTTSLNGADPATTTTVRVITSATVRVIVDTSPRASGSPWPRLHTTVGRGRAGDTGPEAHERQGPSRVLVRLGR